MTTVKDITDQKKLALQLEQTEMDQKKQIEWMLSILHVEPTLLREFMDGSKKELEYNSKLLRPSGSQIDYKALLLIHLNIRPFLLLHQLFPLIF